VNILAPPRARLTVEVVHDLVCPWCYLGLRRLLRTLRARPDLAVDIAWRPFLLNPDMPRLGMSWADYVVRKFGGEDRARRLYATIAQVAATEGLALDFSVIARVPSSVDAHRLVRHAARQGGPTEALVMAIFRAHFAQGRDIGSRAVLAAIAEENAVPDAAAFLASDAETDAVHAENLRAHRLGINGVPCFVIGGRHAIAGAQESEVIERLLDVAALEGA
jgi:predicted DsbA family dithiol-disulfide isomerase